MRDPGLQVAARGVSRKLASGLATLAFCVAASAPVHAQDDSAVALERRVKAAFLYRFAGFVEWPHSAFAGPDSPLTIGVIGDDPLVGELTQTLSGRTVEGRTVAVRRLRGVDQVADTHILFIGRSESSRLGQLIRLVQPKPVFIVTETAGALDAGSTLNFVISEGRVRFEISLPAAEKSGLTLSSRLLGVAQSVRPRAP
jgi:hypothetical protein